MRIFIKIFATLVLFLFAFSNISNSETINSVEVRGNERISKETIVVFGDISLGKNYEINDINILIKKLYETTFFSDISVVLENNKLSIAVKENPIIKTIVFDGEQANKLKEKQRL